MGNRLEESDTKSSSTMLFIILLLYSRLCSKFFTLISLLDFTTNAKDKYYSHPHFTDEHMEKESFLPKVTKK